MDPGVAPVALDEPHAAADPLGLGGEALACDGDHRGVLLDPRDLVPGPGQPQRLRALAHAHVEDAQPLPDGEPPGYLLVELPGDQFLSYDITQTAQLAQPGFGCAPAKDAALRAALRA